MTDHLRDSDRARLGRFGMAELTDAHALELLDLARAADEALTLLVPIEQRRLRSLARNGMVLPLLRGLAPVQARRRADAGGLRRRLLAPVELVSQQVAEVLGRSEAAAVDRDDKLLELGFDSLTAVELVTRLNAETGLRLAPSAAFDHPTPARLAAHVAAHLGGSESAAATTSGANGLLGTMLRHAGESGRAGDFIDLLMQASRFRPAFEWDVDPTPAGTTRLAAGEAAEPLVCFPTVVAMSGPHQFARFAKALQGVRDVAALSYPGFHAGELLPASAEDAAEAALAAVESVSGEAPPVLVGYSSGGILALEVALRLEQRGRPLAGVVLLDPIAADARDEGDFQPELVGRMLDGGGRNGDRHDDARPEDVAAEHAEAAAPDAGDGDGDGYVGVDDTRLTAMGGYLRVLSGCSLPSLAAPVLVAWASQRVGSPERGPALYAEIEHTAVETTGDHFTLIEQHAATTARTVEEWLSDIRSPATAGKAHEKE